MKVMICDLCGDEKWEDTLEGAKQFLIGIWENMEQDEEDMEEDEMTIEEHIENIAAADYDELYEYMAGVGYYLEKIEFIGG